MTGMSGWAPGADALTDPQALLAGDRCGLLPALATAGAQLRSVAEQLDGVVFDRPRSLIVIEPGGTGDGALAAALLPRPRVPVLTETALPSWAGPLDVVVLLAASPHDLPAAEAAAEAARRGVRLVVRGAAHGPVADAAGAALVPPRLAVPELAAGPARLAALLAVGLAADVSPDAARAGGSPGEVLRASADELDAEALACGPGAEPFTNPALALAMRLVDGVRLFVGDDAVGTAVAARCARAIRLLGGRPAAAQHAAGLLPGGQLTAALARDDDPFADPELDGPASAAGVPVLIPPPGDGAGLPGGAGGPTDADRPGDSEHARRIAALARWLPRSLLLTPDRPPANPAAAALALQLRVDFAAAYLGIVAGQVPPEDGPDGLGPAGGVRDFRPATTVEDVTSDIWDDPGGRSWS